MDLWKRCKVMACILAAAPALYAAPNVDNPERDDWASLTSESNIEARLRKIIAEQLGVEETKITPAQRYVEDLGADSLDCIELSMALEDEFAIEIPDEEGDRLSTPGQTLQYLLRRRSEIDRRLPERGGKQGAATVNSDCGLPVILHNKLRAGEPAGANREEDVELLPSGVRIQHIVRGTGRAATSGRTVSIHYSTWLSDGQKVDSSCDRSAPFAFVVGAGMVIKCWDQAIQHMASGGKAILTCPADTAYGSRGAGAVIPPNAELVEAIVILEEK